LSVDVALPPPPVESPTGGGGGGDWVELIRARDDIDAHLLLGRLVEAGVEARTIKDRHAPGAWLYGGSNPWAPVVVLVRRFQLDDARLVLANISFYAPEPAPRGELALDPVRWWLVALALGVALTATTLAQVASQFSGE
jgi:Putative prokaryotic signal transducing protein